MLSTCYRALQSIEIVAISTIIVLNSKIEKNVLHHSYIDADYQIQKARSRMFFPSHPSFSCVL